MAHSGDASYTVASEAVRKALADRGPGGRRIRCFSDGGMRGDSTACGALCAIWFRERWVVVEAIALCLSRDGSVTVPESEHAGVACAVALAERLCRRVLRTPRMMRADRDLPSTVMDAGTIEQAQLLINLAWH